MKVAVGTQKTTKNGTEQTKSNKFKSKQAVKHKQAATYKQGQIKH